MRQETDRRLADLTDNFRFREDFVIPIDMAQAIADLSYDLKEVPVQGSDGLAIDIFTKIEADPTITASDKMLIWSCLTIVRDAFCRYDKNASSADQANSYQRDYQWNTNWKHTRAELDQVLEAAKQLQLNSSETRDALIASIFSDSVKSRGNFIIHNIHGAQAAAVVLSQLLDLSVDDNFQIIERVVQAVREHQVAPPEFMAHCVAITICQKLNLEPFQAPDLKFGAGSDDSPSPTKTVNSIFSKIKDPYNLKHLSDDQRRIAFTPNEKQLLAKVGIEEWWIPYPDRADSLIAHAVIAGDHAINYNNPEGFAKIALIRGPDTEPIFEDATVHDSLISALHSFSDSFRVIRPEVQTSAVEGLRRTMVAVAKVNAIMSEIFQGEDIPNSAKDSKKNTISASQTRVVKAIERAQAANPSLFGADRANLSTIGKKQVEEATERVASILEQWSKEYGEIPFEPTATAPNSITQRRLPFWNTALKYPPRDKDGQLKLDQLDALSLRQFKFAVSIRSIAVELLRAQQWLLGSLV